MLSHLEPYLLMPSALTPTALIERADQLAASAALRDALLGLGEVPVRIRHTPLYDAWLLPWAAGSVADLHSHDGSYGAVAAVHGVLRETVSTADGVRERIVRPGDRHGYRPGDAHRLAAGDARAVTLHLSSPPLPSGPCFSAAPLVGAGPARRTAAGITVR
ncbi:MAG: cysteine dioxygenase [Actinomycetia bacterium]|jgi:hypothetical protein|nr:cysteine dioxygenase [Actinomycetes bacterium]MDQ1654023.1 hypothetical protein [Cryptosporangiaceae bacterium]MDQ1657536.1 hypothetical protein [Cryptosporangiaceae bacterium]